MKKQMKYTCIQILITIIFAAFLFMLHTFLTKTESAVNDFPPVGITGSFLFVTISWIYLLTGLQFQKHPHILNARFWKHLPVIIVALSAVSIIPLIFIANMDVLNRGLLYMAFIFYLILYFYFIFSVVFKLSEDKKKIIHYTYGWSLILLFLFVFFI